MAVAYIVVSTRWFEYLTQLDQDETSKRDQPLVRLYKPVPGIQIVESDAKWSVEEKSGKKGKERELNLLHPNLHRKMTD